MDVQETTVETLTHPANEADLAALVDSMAALWRDDSGRHDPSVNPDWPQREGRPYLLELITNPNGVLLAARAGTGEIAGHLVGRYLPAGDLRTESTAVLESMQVRTDLRGHGVGGQLVDAFLAWAARRQASRTVVTAYTGNIGAQAFYQRHGFTPLSVTFVRSTG